MSTDTPDAVGVHSMGCFGREGHVKQLEMVGINVESIILGVIAMDIKIPDAV